MRITLSVRGKTKTVIIYRFNEESGSTTAYDVETFRRYYQAYDYAEWLKNEI